MLGNATPDECHDGGKRDICLAVLVRVFVTSSRSAAAAGRLRCKQLFVGSNAMKNHGIAPDAIDDEQVGPHMAFFQANPVRAALVEAVLPKCLGSAPPEIKMENVLESLGFKLRMLSRGRGSRA